MPFVLPFIWPRQENKQSWCLNGKRNLSSREDTEEREEKRKQILNGSFQQNHVYGGKKKLRFLKTYVSTKISFNDP
jgi:hypothetical protein